MPGPDSVRKDPAPPAARSPGNGFSLRGAPIGLGRDPGAPSATEAASPLRSGSPRRAYFSPPGPHARLNHRMNVVFTSIYARACMGAGLAVLTGLRAFLPVAFLALYSRLEFASAPILDGTPFAFLEKIWFIALVLALAVIELAVDKMPALHRTRDQVMQPIKIVLGGVVFAAAMAPEGWIAMTVSGILGLVIAGLADRARRSMRPDAGADTGPRPHEHLRGYRRPRRHSALRTRSPRRRPLAFFLFLMILPPPAEAQAQAQRFAYS